MFRCLFMRKNILLPRFLYSSYVARANMFTGSMFQSKQRNVFPDNFSVTDINVFELAKDDVEFQRNFLTTLPMLDKEISASMQSNADAPVPNAVPEPQSNSVVEPATPSSSSNDNCILDRNGLPVIPIEIDGWKNLTEDDDEDDPTVQKPSSIEIGDDDYKKEHLLVVPESREGQVEYKGIKVKLPETASKDVGTYRFRRDAEDMESVGDDMRLAKFDK
ncbi:CG17470 [Drosophila busckii]|uniref:CG17470 n=1 Tax=Drosophila busckii TaxID=30019 RepID=A0A0M4E3C5_DROBS|nr:CG17470 [Drosophila busckii]